MSKHPNIQTSTKSSRKILFVWTGVTSYMADCWRALAGRDGVQLKVVIAQSGTGSGNALNRVQVLNGIDWTESTDLGDWRPDVMFIVGWHNPTCRNFATDAAFADIPKVICFDMPWEWRLRKIAARFVLGRYLRRFAAAFVPGSVAARYARWLGFGEERIFCGLFGIDVSRFGAQSENRRGFLFVGRLASEKNIDILAKAYRQYRARSQSPWELTVYGTGPDAEKLKGIEGVELKGFAQPDEIRAAYARAGAFVIASRWDPWPLVIAESCAAGLPIVCTRNCWNAAELIKGNGIVCPVGDAAQLANALLRIERGDRTIDGSRGFGLIAPYSCEHWAERVLRICEEVGK